MRGAVPILHNLQQKFQEKMDFLHVYIAEAHAMNEWPINSSRDSITGEAINFKQPVSDNERIGLANKFIGDYSFKWPTVIDLIENPFEALFASWPLRFYVIHDGKLSFKAQPENSTYDFNYLRDHLVELEGSLSQK